MSAVVHSNAINDTQPPHKHNTQPNMQSENLTNPQHNNTTDNNNNSTNNNNTQLNNNTKSTGVCHY